MKSFLIYSGKGGVGKSTITSCLYKAFEDAGKTVLVLDMDLNTPSMSLLLDEGVISPPPHFIFANNAIIKKHITDSIIKIKKIKPDILLIDSPPSISDLHRILLKKMAISSVILVTQPTTLSVSDVNRTIPFLIEENLAILGIIENMVEKTTMEFKYDKLLSIKRTKKDVYLANKTKFKTLVATILALNVKEVTQKNRIQSIFNESYTEQDVLHLYNLYEEDGELKRKKGFNSNIKFVNLKTWSMLHDYFVQLNYFRTTLFAEIAIERSPVVEATYERVSRLVKAFEIDSEALFLVTKAPSTEITIVPGEIGTCNIKIDEKFNGIPTVEYHTAKGSVRLFPHEVIPATAKMVADSISSNAKYIEEGRRLIPAVETIVELSINFGNRIGLPEYDTKESTIKYAKNLIDSLLKEQ